MPAAPPLLSRQALYRFAWILFIAGIVLPAPSGSFQGGASAISGLLVIGKAIQWNDAASRLADHINLAALTVFTLALFSNVVFLFTPAIRKRRSISTATKILLLTLLAINAGVMFLIPLFAKMPAYWLWLAAFAVLTFAFIALPGSGASSAKTAPKTAAKPGAKRSTPAAASAEPGEVPALIWVWLGWTVFWLAVTALNTSHPPAPQERIALTRTDTPAAALTSYFTDSAALLPPADLERLQRELEQFEQQTSNQIAVAIYPHAPQGAIEEFTIHVAERSRLGRKGLDNGAILFLFVAERSARLEVGYGLEDVLTDVEARRILDARLAPAFRQGAYQQGIAATLAAIKDSVRSAYQRDRMPGKLAVLWRQMSVELPKLAQQAWPTISALDLQARIAIGFFGTLLGLGILDGGKQTWTLCRNLVRCARNLLARRPFGEGTLPMQFESMWDTLKILVVVVGAIAAAVGIVVVAGGGTFGGAGTLVRW